MHSILKYISALGRMRWAHYKCQQLEAPFTMVRKGLILFHQTQTLNFELKMISEIKLLSILAYVQRGMLGYVTPNLRALYVLVENDTTFELIFYYDKPLSEDEEELASLIDTEVISAFPSPFYRTDYSVEVLPYPNKITEDGYCVYRRYEKS